MNAWKKFRENCIDWTWFKTRTMSPAKKVAPETLRQLKTFEQVFDTTTNIVWDTNTTTDEVWNTSTIQTTFQPMQVSSPFTVATSYSVTAPMTFKNHPAKTFNRPLSKKDRAKFAIDFITPADIHLGNVHQECTTAPDDKKLNRLQHAAEGLIDRYVEFGALSSKQAKAWKKKLSKCPGKQNHGKQCIFCGTVDTNVTSSTFTMKFGISSEA